MSVWGRDYLFGESALPTGVVSQGRDLLAGPMRLVCRDAAGSDFAWTRLGHLVLDHSDEHADICAWQGNSNVVVDVSAHIEFDGFMKMSVALVPGPARGKAPASVWLEIPLRPDVARLYQYNPMLKWGEFDNAGGIHGRMELPFASTFWIGDDEAGLGWFCENEAPLEVEDRKRVIEVEPGEKETVFRVRLADRPVAMPYTWTFGIEATPVKPWRENVLANRVVHAMGMATLSTTSKRPERWWTAHHAFPEGLHTVERELDFVRASGARTIAFHEDWIPVQNCALYQKDFRRIVDACHARGLKVIVYQGYEISPLDPIWGEHGEEWITRDAKGGYSDLWYREPAQRDYRGCYNCGFKSVWLERLMKAYDALGLDGVYLDGTASPLSCANTRHGCGMKDSSGTLRETHPIFSTREQMKAVYRFVHSRGGIVNVHNSTYMGVATLAFADSTWDGEQIAFSKFDPKENLTLEGIRAELSGRNYGISSEFLAYEKGTEWLVEDALALMMIHGVLVRPCGFQRIAKVAGIWDALERFGIVGAEFVPYWKNPVPGLPERVFTSQYRKRGETLAIVSNLNKTKKLDVEYPLPQGKTSAFDAVTGVALPVSNGKAAVRIAAFRMRIVAFR